MDSRDDLSDVDDSEGGEILGNGHSENGLSSSGSSLPSDNNHDNHNNNNANINNNNDNGEDSSKSNQTKQEVLVERTVVTDSLIRNAVYKDLLTYYDANSVSSEEELDLSEVTQLVLSFRNIYAIQNLEGFEKLKKLQLDNNIIERIQNIGHLTNLTWLDLSFNRLREISGLELLVNLTDLSLFDNRIRSISGLDTLTNLNVLSLGNNLIGDLQSIKQLRKFKNLRLLNLKGNPVCNDDDYENTIFAFLPHLKYLDYVAIDPKLLAKAQDSKLDQLLILEHSEKAIVLQEKEAEKQRAYTQLLNSANLEGLSSLFDEMIRADIEYMKIKLLPGFEKVLENYNKQFHAVLHDFMNEILQRHTTKCDEKQQFQQVRDRINREAEEQSIHAIQAYEKNKKKSMRECALALRGGGGASIGNPQVVLEKLVVEASSLSDHLMDIEMYVVEQHGAIIDEFEKCYMKLISENVIKIGACFRQLIDVSNKHVASLYDLAHRVLESFAKDENFGDSLDVQVKALLADKDAVNNAISASHENHDAKILLKEDEIRDREEGAGRALIRSIRREEYIRNRKRVAEIYELRAREEATIQATRHSTHQDDDDKIYN